MNYTFFMDEARFRHSLEREIERRSRNQKVTSITKEQLEEWIDSKMDFDLSRPDETFCEDICLPNGRRGCREDYGSVHFTDEVMELVFKLYELTKHREMGEDEVVEGAIRFLNEGTVEKVVKCYDLHATAIRLTLNDDKMVVIKIEDAYNITWWKGRCENRLKGVKSYELNEAFDKVIAA